MGFYEFQKVCVVFHALSMLNHLKFKGLVFIEGMYITVHARVLLKVWLILYYEIMAL